MKQWIAFLLLLTATFSFASSLPQMNDAQITQLPSQAPIVLVNFWATWCKPCNVEIAALNRLHEKFPDVRFIGVNVDEVENAGAIPGFLKKHPISYDVILRRGKNFEAMASSLDPNWKGGIPATFVFLGGRRIFSKTSMIEEGELDRALEQAVKDK